MGRNRRRSAREVFARQALAYATQAPFTRDAVLPRMAEWAELRGEERLLDVACGAGFTAFALAPRLKMAVGVDATEAMLAHARRLARERGMGNARFVAGSAESLPFPGESFEVVTCRYAGHHFASLRPFLSEVRRVLSPGGRLVIVDTAGPEDGAIRRWMERAERLRDLSHVRNRTPAEWRSAAAGAGLRLLREAGDHRIELEFEEWAERGGCRGRAREELAGLFRSAPPGARALFDFRWREEELRFAWPAYLALFGRAGAGGGGRGS